MTLLKGGTILFIASTAGSLCNYLFQFYMSRRLALDDFGVMNSAFSLLIMAGVPVSAIMFVVARYASSYNAGGENGKVASLYRNSLAKMGLVATAVFIVSIFFKGPVSSYLNIESPWPVAFVSAGVFISFIATVNLGMLQGLKSFYWLGAAFFCLGSLKLVSGVSLVEAGAGVDGAIASVVIATLLVSLITAFPLARWISAQGSPADKGSSARIAAYGAPVLIASIIFAVMTNIDLVMVRHIFTAEEAGLYSAVSVLGKTILYLPASFVLALFPMASEAETMSADSFKILEKGLAYVALFSAPGVVMFAFFPELILESLFGPGFAAAAPLLKIYGAAMFFMSIVSVIMSFSLARSKTSFLYPLGLACLGFLVLINLYHPSLVSVVITLASAAFFAAAFGLLAVYRDRRLYYAKARAVEAEAAGRRLEC